MNTDVATDKKTREQQLRDWSVAALHLKAGNYTWHSLSGDASFRRYFRLCTTNKTWVVVDAPPEHEDSRQFCFVAELFKQQGCCVPDIIATDFEFGFMLLEDLGDKILLSELNAENVDRFYQGAFQQLLCLQSGEPQVDALPIYDAEKLLAEMALFREWFIPKYLGLTLSPEQQAVIQNAEQIVLAHSQKQKQVYVHRDFHSRNLMILENENNDAAVQLALIDFQDAVIGPMTYDLVSLLKDVYVEWPAVKRAQLLRHYFEALLTQGLLPGDTSFESFFDDFEWMGVQRHLKILGIFARLSLRDGKDGYLSDMPLTFKYLEEAIQEQHALKDFNDLLANVIKPAFVEKQSSSGLAS